jgi:predicted O-methyltransferase YrrM
MTRRTLPLTDRLYDYLLATTLREHPALERLRVATAALPEGGMQSAPEQGQLMGLLVELIGARRVLEIGCFTGYSTLAMALALPPDGRLLTLDVNPEWVELGRRAWREAGVEGRIEVRFGLAQASLDQMIEAGGAGSFDLVFIDADKKSYDAYYERSLVLVRPGGLIMIDNVLWGGAVADPANRDRQTEALRALNAKLHADSRVSLALVPIGDGLMLARRRRLPTLPASS